MAPTTASPTPRPPASNLPADTTSFVGRRAELTTIRALLGSARLVTLTGTGGVGKTRLAVKAAADGRGGFTDGVWLVELAPLRQGDDVTHAVADVLGLRTGPGTPLLEAIAAHLAERTALLVLDNCEHVIEGVTGLVHELLRRCAGLRVVATSREPLGLTAEHVVAVPPLPVPGRDSTAGPDALARYDSVNLFVERAAAGCPGFALTNDNNAAVVSICSALEGIPLAIELAAVRVRSLPLDAILARLKDGSACPGREPYGAPSHHRTLRASVEWSHELCSPDERTLWARLSVFSGGFDLDAAHAVCSGPGKSLGMVTDAIAALVDKSILVHEPSACGGRYRMLEILREFGEEQLAATAEGPGDTVDRHRGWFVALAEASAMCWLSGEQVAVLDRLRAEYGNLRVAFTRSLPDPATVSSALVIASALEHYWLIRGWQSEGRQWLDEALAASSERTVERARALRVDAYLTAVQGDAAAAATLVREARSIAEVTGDSVELHGVAMVEGVVELCGGRVEQARERLECALEGFQADRHTVGEAYTLVILVAVAAAMEDAALAELCHRRCMELTEARQEVHLRGFSLWGRGLAALRDGDPAAALALQRESLALKRSLHDQLGMVLCLEALAWVAVAEGDGERAGVLLGGSERLWSPMRMTIGSIFDFGRFRAEYDGILAERLGRRRLETMMRRGSRMTVDQVLRYALGEEDTTPAETSPLTPREQQIAGMVAQGLTNRRIAHDLTLSQRTVEGHVEKIMTKLGFARRTQIAAWTAEQRADGDRVPGDTLVAR